jgi:two-component system, NtrC family, response regulator HydG
MANILVIDDELVVCHQISRVLNRQGHRTDISSDKASAINLLKNRDYDLIFCDFKLSDSTASELLPLFTLLAPDTPVIIITGHSDTRTAVQLMKAGASNYLIKPLITEVIIDEAEKALLSRNVNRSDNPSPSNMNGNNQSPQFKSPYSHNYAFPDSSATRDLLKQVRAVAKTNYSIIILGESGTGKEAIAHTIHQQSHRSSKPFVAVDSGSLTHELARSEFFGHEKGAFTGAISQKKGYFELADGGTLFLDEITNLSLEIQAVLLRAIQERKIYRVGSQKVIPVDIRIVVASNKSLKESVANGTFREDLYHRLNEFSINIPPLRKRKSEIEFYANHFLNENRLVAEKQISGIEPDVIDLMKQHDWPGNLRELNNVIKRSVLLCKGPKITRKCLPPDFGEKSDPIRSAFPTPHTTTPGNRDLKESSAKAEKQAILKALKAANYNKTETARRLGIDRKTLYNKLKRYNIKA